MILCGCLLMVPRVHCSLVALLAHVEHPSPSECFQGFCGGVLLTANVLGIYILQPVGLSFSLLEPVKCSNTDNTCSFPPPSPKSPTPPLPHSPLPNSLSELPENWIRNWEMKSCWGGALYWISSDPAQVHVNAALGGGFIQIHMGEVLYLPEV